MSDAHNVESDLLLIVSSKRRLANSELRVCVKSAVGNMWIDGIVKTKKNT